MQKAFMGWTVGLVSLGFALTSQAVLLGTYNFATSESDVPTAANMTFNAFSSANLTTSPLAAAFRRTDWNTGNAIDTTEYVQFSVKPTVAYILSISDISWSSASSKTTGPNAGELRIWLGTPDATPDYTTTWTPTRNSTVNPSFTGINLTGTYGQEVFFRYYAWGAKAGGTLSFDNVAVGGTLAPVPEPVNIALAVFGFCAVGVGVGRRYLAKGKSKA
jgi:hypothetical protein